MFVTTFHLTHVRFLSPFPFPYRNNTRVSLTFGSSPILCFFRYVVFAWALHPHLPRLPTFVLFFLPFHVRRLFCVPHFYRLVLASLPQPPLQISPSLLDTRYVYVPLYTSCDSTLSPFARKRSSIPRLLPVPSAHVWYSSMRPQQLSPHCPLFTLPKKFVISLSCS